MTPDKIASTILDTLQPGARKSWECEVGPATPFLELTFRPVAPILVLDIGAILSCFQDDYREVSWQGDLTDEPDLPSIVFKGGVGGSSVQAVFVLHNAND